jgi:endonuclease/exonuclease/phosphatase family metal-dependent hydrolase
MSFSFMSWNIRHFKAATDDRIQQVSDLISGHDPDIFGIIEFQAKDAARRLISEHFTDYDFGMTDSKMQLDFLIGWKRGLFEQVLYTQRRDFMAGNIHLRPGGLLSVLEPGRTNFTNLLFLHTDSGKGVKDYNARQAMFKKIWNLKQAIEDLPIQNGESRLIALGDLNTMGRSRTNTLPTIRALTEIENLTSDAQNAGMRMLSKSHPKTWSNGPNTKTSNLDHVIASDDLLFEEFGPTPNEAFEIEVDGWNNVPSGTNRTDWIKNISDHCALIGKAL